MAKLEDLIARDTRANQPTAGVAGRLYFVDDENVLERDTGSTWTGVNPYVAARYTTNAGQSIPDNTWPPTIINFEDKDYDTHDAVTVGASWKFTAPYAGVYSVKCFTLFNSSGTWASGEGTELCIFKNGNNHSEIARIIQESSTNLYVPQYGSDDVYLDAGEYIDIRIYQFSGGALSLYTSAIYNYVSIHRVA